MNALQNRFLESFLYDQHKPIDEILREQNIDRPTFLRWTRSKSFRRALLQILHHLRVLREWNIARAAHAGSEKFIRVIGNRGHFSNYGDRLAIVNVIFQAREYEIDTARLRAARKARQTKPDESASPPIDDSTAELLEALTHASEAHHHNVNQP